jgi:hypothetical protein
MIRSIRRWSALLPFARMTSSDSGSDISGGILDRQDDARRVIPRAWPAKRENLRAATAEMRQTMQEKNPPIWVMKDNKRSVKKKGRPHPAAECVFVQLMRSYLHTIHGENTEKKFEEELSKVKDTTKQAYAEQLQRQKTQALAERENRTRVNLFARSSGSEKENHKQKTQTRNEREEKDNKGTQTPQKDDGRD